MVSVPAEMLSCGKILGTAKESTAQMAATIPGSRGGTMAAFESASLGRAISKVAANLSTGDSARAFAHGNDLL